MKHLILVLLSIIFLISCGKDSEPSPVSSPTKISFPSTYDFDHISDDEVKYFVVKPQNEFAEVEVSASYENDYKERVNELRADIADDNPFRFFNFVENGVVDIKYVESGLDTMLKTTYNLTEEKISVQLPGLSDMVVYLNEDSKNIMIPWSGDYYDTNTDSRRVNSNAKDFDAAAKVLVEDLDVNDTFAIFFFDVVYDLK